MEKAIYIDTASTLDFLKMDSGLLPKPNEEWNVFAPKDGDVAHVDKDNSDYVFKDGDWVKLL